MPMPLQQRVRFAGAPRRSRVEVNGLLALQQRVVQAPGRLGEVRTDEECLDTDHHIAERRFIGVGELAEGCLVVELQRMIGEAEGASRAFHGKTEGEPFAWLEGDEQLIGGDAARLEGLKDLGGRLAKDHCDLGHLSGKALARPEIEGYALPSPVVDVYFQRYVSVGQRVSRHAGLFAIAFDRLIADLPGCVLPEDRSEEHTSELQ